MRAFDNVFELPDETNILPGHEYTVANLNFATKLEKDNLNAADHLQKCSKLRAESKFTIPSTIGKITNTL